MLMIFGIATPAMAISPRATIQLNPESHVSPITTTIIDGEEVEVSVATASVAVAGAGRANWNARGYTTVTRPLIGNLRATATTRTDVPVQFIGAMVTLNTGATVVRSPFYVNVNTILVRSREVTGGARTGVGHGNHEFTATMSSSSIEWRSMNTSFNN